MPSLHTTIDDLITNEDVDIEMVLEEDKLVELVAQEDSVDAFMG